MPFGIHELWLIVPVVLMIGGYSIKKQRLDSEAAIGIVSDPALLKAIHTEMPAWFYDSDVDRVRWINQLLDTMWPSLDQVSYQMPTATSTANRHSSEYPTRLATPPVLLSIPREFRRPY